MFKLRGCQKCHGDLYLGEDSYGAYLSCVQCGRHYAVAEATGGAESREAAASVAGPPEVAGLELAA